MGRRPSEVITLNHGGTAKKELHTGDVVTMRLKGSTFYGFDVQMGSFFIARRNIETITNMPEYLGDRNLTKNLQ